MNQITSPMPGKINKVLVRAGDKVTAETQVLIHEAMKMENAIVAGSEGTIVEISIAEGDSVELGQVLMTLG
ncbi:acetyl-CoA carboxylase biotin carboxyl carrier protein subunit [bacterium]|nr:acetyl-CoA carboxylase biotin carboxyl carrier protein subunit [bacterium]